MQPGWIDASHRSALLGHLLLESGDTIEDLYVSYVVHGDLDDRSKPVVLGLCAIGSTHHRLDFLIGKGRALDPSLYTIIVVDALGNGLSSSPSSSVTQPRDEFPRFTIRDMVHSQKLLMEHMQIDNVHAVVGASMGGMQALQWGVSFPDFMSHIIALVPMAKTAPWAQAVNEAARLALRAGTSVEPGTVDWSGWVAIMHVLSMRTPVRFASDCADVAVSDWLARRSEWWADQQLDPLDWIYQSWAYDAHDVGTTTGFAGDTERALAAIRAKTLIAVPKIDLYNPVDAGIWAARHIENCRLVQLASGSGHLAASEADQDAAGQIDREIQIFLER
ncbi:alpha/beta fold hydrolase [Paraburkholderia caribensis]|uniref:alpha/beta fold hydrolase n=1 Tax=Paraburkholderia caribensis TaxID=75105 RepID=UPI001591C5AA|nr:alpha/beta fold hydrolase [Paraburkholderia caribensis]